MSLDLQTIDNTNTDKLGFFRFKRFEDGTYLITNDGGKFHFFDEQEFNSFIVGDFSQLKGMEETLTQKGFIKNEDYQTRMT